jgi:dihydrofolate synthase / folylpolyglutamate synthase
MKFEQYKQAEDFLVSLANLPRWEWWHDQSKPVIYLKRMKILLMLLGSPQDANIKYIHVTGTSGKGSTVAMIHSILTEAGFKTGAYFSPYTTTAIERYFIGRKLVSPKVFADTVEEIKPAIERAMKLSPWGAPSYVEVATAMAFLIFKKARLTHAVIEAVAGGENDSTNVIKNPMATVITNVADDHRNILGPTLADIAHNKAGIIKRGAPVVTGVTNKKLLKIIADKAKKMNAPLHIINPPLARGGLALHKRVNRGRGMFDLQLKGHFQQKNAVLAHSVGQLLNINEEIILQGLKKAWLPCRMEVMQKNPTVIIDAAHNPDKIKSLMNSLKNPLLRGVAEGRGVYPHLYKGGRKGGNIWTIAGFVERKGKQYTNILKNISMTSDYLILTRTLNPYFKSVDLNKFDEKLKKRYPVKFPISRGTSRHKSGRGVSSCKYLGFYLDPFEALNFVLKKAGKRDLVLITGSIYLCGELRQNWHSEDHILQKLWAK